MSKDKIVIKGAREHNLKNVDIEIPRDALIVFTGLSGSGKSTVARALEKALVERGVHAAVLDGDNLRHGLNRDAELLRAAGHTPRAARRFGLGFSAEDTRGRAAYFTR